MTLNKSLSQIKQENEEQQMALKNHLKEMFGNNEELTQKNEEFNKKFEEQQKKIELLNKKLETTNNEENKEPINSGENDEEIKIDIISTENSSPSDTSYPESTTDLNESGKDTSFSKNFNEDESSTQSKEIENLNSIITQKDLEIESLKQELNYKNDNKNEKEPNSMNIHQKQNYLKEIERLSKQMQDFQELTQMKSTQVKKLRETVEALSNDLVQRDKKIEVLQVAVDNTKQANQRLMNEKKEAGEKMNQANLQTEVKYSFFLYIFILSLSHSIESERRVECDA